jgi:hypothetical protein
MASLKTVESLDNYGDANIFPIYGGKLAADGTLTARH